MANALELLLERFPEQQDAIERLTESNVEFNECCREYGEVSGEIELLSASPDPAQQDRLDALRQRRANLDEIMLAMMQQTARV